MARGWIEAAKITGFSVAAAIVYGVLHDQVTAHVCVEYFSVAHPPVFPTTSPFLLALGWGVIATWWVGLPLGLGLAAAARIGRAPRFGLAEVRSAVVKLMLVTGVLALLAGLVGAFLGARGDTALFASQFVPPEKYVAFSFDAFAHEASYDFGAIGGLVVIVLTVRRRRRARAQNELPKI
jgi:hypothetical protein